METTSETQGSKSPRIFISYSRADRQRVEGLVDLLKALQHEVFMDKQSILPGMRWQDKLEKELHSADVCLVFWTRYAERSKWVRREYETFLTKFPDRPLVPILGDTTPLSEQLAARQHTDFCPLLNELLATTRDLEGKRVGKRAIRAAILKRLEEEGIELPPDKRKRLFGFIGVLGLTTAPLHFLSLGRDLFIDQAVAIPVSYYYTAAAAAASSLIVCHTLSGDGHGLKVDGRIVAPDLFQVEVSVDQSGSDACDTKGMICVSMSRSSINDHKRKFFGYSTPTCSAKVIRRPSCKGEYETDFSVNGVVLRRSPKADEEVKDLSKFDYFCISSDKGKKGIYEFANCVKP